MSKFLYPMLVYYGETGHERNIPTTSVLPLIPAPAHDLLILEQRMGSRLSGLYMHDGSGWRFILESTYLGESIVENNPIVIYCQLRQSVDIAVGSISYINGVLLNSLTLMPGTAIYAVRLPAAVGPAPPPVQDPEVKTFIAQSVISGHRITMLTTPTTVGLLKNTDVEFCSAALGITEGAASAGSLVKIRISGLISEIGWDFISGKPVFCGLDGQVTQVPPTSGFSLVVGVATGPNSVFISIKQPFILS